MGNDGVVLLIVPSDPLKPRRPDEHFAPEYDAAQELGIEVALVDHDALAAGDAANGVSSLPASPDAVYRGWMLGSSTYDTFESEAGSRGCRLRTSGVAFRQAHELPGWIDRMAAFTAPTVWTPSAALEEFDLACREVGSGPAVLRDYTKSEKHYWDEAAFIPDVADASAARAIATRLLELRGTDFTGGFVLRRFEEYVSAEVRTWWVDGHCALVTAHPDTTEALPEDYVEPSGLATAIESLGLPFVTADLARRVDGQWRLIEVGDGQMSDRPTSCATETLIAAVNR